MSARDAILSSVRGSLGAKSADPGRRALAEARIAAKARHPIPERVAGKDGESLRTIFKTYLEASAAHVVTVASDGDVPAAISDFLRKTNLPQSIRTGSDPELASLDWGSAPTLEVKAGAADREDAVGVSRALAGVAETGTLMLASGPENPVTLNFLPETHIVVVRASEVVGAYEDGFDRVRARFGEGQMPRTVNMVSGPSRTGDIGGRIVLGAHGPRRLCVILIEG